MRDGYDWSVLERGTDPVPGDPGVVLVGGRQYVEVADAIGRSVARLRTIDAGGQHVSEAIDALMDTAREVADSIQRAEGRYRETGEALLGYAPVLMTAQDATLEAWTLASSARADAAEAESSRTYYLSLAGDSAEPEQVLHYENLAASAEETAAHAAGLLARALEQTEDAVGTRDQAAERAMQRIQDFIGGDGLADSWWDNWGSDLLAAVTDIAGWVATIAGVLALAVSWIPVIGQALAAGLLVVAGVAAVINAIGNVVLAGTGERSWTEAGMSILGAALSVVGLGAAARLAVPALSRGVAAARHKLGAASRINAMARTQPGWKGERLTRLQAMRLQRSTLDESDALWRSALPAPRQGDDVFRLYSKPGAGPDGASFSPSHPDSFAGSHRELLGLPKQNKASDLVVAQLDDPAQIVLQRHALPLHGNPGGAPEWIIPGRGAPNQELGLTILRDVTYRVP